MVLGVEGRLCHQTVHRIGAAVMVLVVRAEHGLGDVLAGNLTGCHRLEYLIRADRVEVVEVLDGLQG